MNQVLNGTVALVTGASSGIGEATARALVRRGASVVAVARRQERLAGLAAECGVANCLAVQADIADREQVDNAIDTTIRHFGRLDILVNNAGIGLRGRVDLTPSSEWERLLAVNVQGALYATQSGLPHLIAAARDSPRRISDLVNITSTAAYVPRVESAFYTLAKAGLQAFSEALRQEVRNLGVRVSVVAPGSVATEISSRTRGGPPDPHRFDGIEQLTPEDISDAVCYVVTRDRRVSVNQMLVRATDQTW